MPPWAAPFLQDQRGQRLTRRGCALSGRPLHPDWGQDPGRRDLRGGREERITVVMTRTKNIKKQEQKSTDTRVVGISSMRKSIYLLKTTPSSHTHRFHPLPLATPTSCSPHPLATPIHSTHSPQLSSILFNLCKVQSMDDNCGVGGMMGVVSRRWV